MNDCDQVENLYQEGVALTSTQRQSLLAERCVDRPDLAAEVLALWDNSNDDDSVFDFNALPELSRAVITLQGRRASTVYEHIGPFRILARLAGGGMGTVYKAEQREPILRTVAIKVLDRLICSEELYRRFRDEQRALAMLTHPYIATVFDSGFTRDGLPYFVMEFLDGAPITSWCDDHQLDIPARLELFCAVCKGVQHAHHRGITHRDLKPENVLVVERDGKPVPKIIDFGVAKLADNTDTPNQTRIGMIIGTPAYMSPEQASGQSEGSIDARTDIYSLGVLLYRLLVGVTPLGEEIDKVNSMREACHIVTEMKPRSMVCTIRRRNPEIMEIARNLGTNPKALATTLSGELDWVTLKALAREPGDRYQSAAALAEDIRRYLADEPVLAAKPSAWYSFYKLVKRHKRLSAVAAALVLSLVLGLFGTTTWWLRARNAEADQRQTNEELRLSLARVHAVRHFSENIFALAGPNKHGPDVSGLELLATASKELATLYRDQPDMEASTRMVLAACYKGLGTLDEARFHYEQAQLILTRLHSEDADETLNCTNALAFIHYLQGNTKEAEALYRSNRDIWAKRHGKDHPFTLKASGGLAQILADTNRLDEALPIFQETLIAQDRILSPNDESLLANRNNYGLLLLKKGNSEEAGRLFLQNLKIHQRYKGETHLFTANALNNLGLSLMKAGEFDQASRYYQKALIIRQERLGENHPDTLTTLNNLAVLKGNQGLIDDAVVMLKAVYEALVDKEIPAALLVSHNLGNFLMEAERHKEADILLKEVLALRRKVLGPDHPHTLVTWMTVGENQLKQGLLLKAEHTLVKAVAAAAHIHGAEAKKTTMYNELLNECRVKLKAVSGQANQ